MRFLLLIFLSTSIYAQKLIRNPYADYYRKMDARAIANFNLHLVAANKATNHILYYSPSHWLVLSMQTRLNSGAINKVTNGFDNMLDRADANNYMNIAAYNVRSKVYLSKKVR